MLKDVISPHPEDVRVPVTVADESICIHGVYRINRLGNIVLETQGNCTLM